jgi:hypothetical protein
MSYNVLSGEIVTDTLYRVTGEQSVTYNSVTYEPGATFKGVTGANTFEYIGVGIKELNEVLELRAFAIEYVNISSDNPVYDETTVLKSFNVEYELNDAEKIVNEVTRLQGFALELIDYPFYSFEITETRL